MPDGYSQIEWKKQQPPTPQNPNPNYDPNSSENSFDKLEFERKGDENVNVTISLARDTERERYKLSPGLAEILDSEEEDMLGAVQGIWEYARAMNLQEDDDKRTIVCDEPLRKVSNACTELLRTMN
jgi:SWI/SNF-related matrix-associated actin-dependent regulator of chromatin subfamily D